MSRKSPFVALSALLAVAAHASGPAVTLADATSPEASNVLLGWSFTPTADVYVTGLGYVDLGADGLATSHGLGIFDVDANRLVTSATLAAGTASTKIGDFRYAAADGAKLAMGKRYMVVGTNDRDPWTTNGHATASFASEIAPDGVATYNYGANSLGIPTDRYFRDGNPVYGQYFGPSFTYSTQAVPEPASMAALGLGALGLLRRRRAR